jgi:O-antigen ligase
MKRQIFIFSLVFITFLSSLTLTLTTLSQRDFMLRGYVDATQNQDLPFRVPRLGVNAELTQYTDSELHHHFALMQQANVHWVRQIVRWDLIEPRPSDYDWQTWDTIIEAIEAYPTLELVAVIQNTPEWALPENAQAPTTPPADNTYLADFLTAFAQRYGDTVNYYQIWDEPNLTAAWGGSHPRPAHYVAMLQASYVAIHAADPTATVIAASLAPTTEQGPENINEMDYLRALYQLGAADYWDAIAAKPYGFDHPPTDRTVSLDILNFSRIVALREVMLAHNDATTPLWASHWGWNALPEEWAGDASIWGSVSPTQQQDYTLTALNRAEREWPWLGGMILHHWQPDAPHDSPQWGFSVLQQDGTPGSLWQTLARYQPEQAASNGLYHALNPYAHYSGVWSFSDLGADIGWVNDSQAHFDFSGQDIALLLRQDDYVAYLYPSIDGEPSNAPPLDAADNPYILLTSPDRTPQLTLIPVATHLDDGLHQLSLKTDKLVLEDSVHRWAIAGYAVSSGNLIIPYNQQLAIALFAMAVTAASVIITGWKLPWGNALHGINGAWNGLHNAGQLILSIFASLVLMLGLLLTWSENIPLLFRREPVNIILALLTTGLIYLEPGLIITLIALLVLFFTAYHKPIIGLILTLGWSPFFLFPIALYHYAFPMAEVLILVTFSAWLARTVITWARRYKQQMLPSLYAFLTQLNAIDYGVIAWVGLGALSLTWAQHRAVAMTDFRVMMLEPALFYLIFRTQRLTKREIMQLVDALLIAALSVAVIGFWLFLQGEALITAEEGARRLASVYGSPNNVALLMGRSIPFALAYALTLPNGLRRYFAALTTLILTAALLLSQSAGGIFIGLPLSVAVILLLHWRKKAILPLAGLSALAIGGFAVAMQSARFARLLDFTSGTNFARIRVWQSALNIIQDHPLYGIGPDQFLYAFRSRYILPDAWKEPDLSHPHNFILDSGVRFGLLGIGVFLYLQIAFWNAARKLYQTRQRLSLQVYALTLGVMGSMANLLGHGLIDNSLYVQDLAIIFMLLLGLVSHLPNASAIDGNDQIMV